MALTPGERAGVGRMKRESELRGEAPIWQKRFWEHHIRDDDAFAALARYCWIAPVKHGLVEHPKDWPHSSWHRCGWRSGDLVGCAFMRIDERA